MLDLVLRLAARYALPAVAAYVAHRTASRAARSMVGDPNRKPDSVDVPGPETAFAPLPDDDTTAG